MSDIRTFHPRRGRVSTAQADAIARLTPVYGLPAGPVEIGSLFGGRPVVLEIGFGLGHATVDLARADPSTGIIAADIHTPGVGRLLLEIEVHNLDNVRVEHGDAVALLRERIPADSLTGIRAFFPDPWPKARHHKRRLIRPDLVQLMATRLAVGGTLHVATDWVPYAESMLDVLSAEPLLVNAHDDVAERGSRPMTKFEQAGLAAGRQVTDLVFRRR